LYYEHAHYLSKPFFVDMAQRRHDKQRSKGVGGGVGNLEEQLLKQVSNSAYGYSCLENSRFSNTSVVTGETLAKNKILEDPRVSNVSVLGVSIRTPAAASSTQGRPSTMGQKKRPRRDTDAGRRDPQIIFAVTRANPDAHIENINQLGAAVLSSSRVLYLGDVSELLELMDPRLVEKLYSDTDSILVATTHERIEDNLLKPGDPDSLSRLRAILVDPTSEVQQGGRFKCEGTYTAGLFRSSKCYFLRLHREEETRRMRSVPRRTQALLDPAIFGQDPTTQNVVVGRRTLRATKGFQMTIQEEYQRTSHGFNFQRIAHVSETWTTKAVSP
jgi:hypothetical protein